MWVANDDLDACYWCSYCGGVVGELLGVSAGDEVGFGGTVDGGEDGASEVLVYVVDELWGDFVSAGAYPF